MDKDFVIEQLRDGDKTARDIAEAYVWVHPDVLEPSAVHMIQKTLKTLERFGVVESVGTVRMTFEVCSMVRGRVHSTHDLKLWRLVQ